MDTDQQASPYIHITLYNRSEWNKDSMINPTGIYTNGINLSGKVWLRERKGKEGDQAADQLYLDMSQASQSHDE